MLRPARRRMILSLPVHLYHFTPETLTAVLAAAGFRVTRSRLTNPAWLEWLFALRTKMKKGKGTSAPTFATTDLAPPQPMTSRRSRWRQEILPWIRSRFPGWTFQVVAVPDRTRSS